MRIAIIVPDNRDEQRRYEQPAPTFGTAPSALLAGMAGRKDLEVHVLACARRSMPAPERLAGNIHYHQLLVGSWGGLRGIYLPCIAAVRRALRAIAPALVHGQGTERYCALAAGFSGFPSLVTIHGNMRALARLYQARPFSFLWVCARLEALALRRVGGVLCLTNHTKREVAALAKRTYVLPNAVNPRFFEVERRPMPGVTLLCIAGILKHKNQLALMEALAPLADRLPLRVKFAGSGAEGDIYYQEFKRRLSGAPWCEHDGFWPLDRLIGEMANATLLVLPSLEDNCPMAVMEAMAAGLPVAAARSGGIPDLIASGRNGVLFDPADLADMRQAIGRLLEQPAYREELGQAGRQAARERWTPAAIAEGHCRIYADFLGA